MKKKLIVASAVLVTLSSVAVAQFGMPIPGVPQVVVDFGAIAHLATQAEQLAQEYALLTQTYQTTVNSYNQLVSNAKMITGKDGWRYAAQPWLSPTSANAYGTSGGWMGTLNSGVGAVQAYDMATVRMSNPATMIGTMTTGAQNRWAQEQATAELNRGIATHAMSVTGSERAMAAARQAALNRLQNDSLSNDPLLNTTNGLLNKVNAASVINAQGVQSQNQLLTTIVDQNTVGMKQLQDTMADAVNSSVAAQAATEKNTRSIWGDRGQQVRMRLGGN